MEEPERSQDDGAARAQLSRADPVLARLIARQGAVDLWAWRRDWPAGPFGLLLRIIVGQQISTEAANAIFARLQRLLAPDLSPGGVGRRTDDELRGAGLSRAKVVALRDLSARVSAGELTPATLAASSDDEIRRRLLAVRGVGAWTVEVFLLTLGRADALPAGDVGLRRAVRAAYGLDHLPGAAEVEALGESWRPHRSLAAAYLYRSLHESPAARTS
jgi:DNA-3-methyladenine glycosylase II